MQSTLTEVRCGISGRNRMKRQLKGGEKNQWEKINVKVVKAIPISFLIYSF
jgi:hypothetical protein